jgi:hypothetical protein
MFHFRWQELSDRYTVCFPGRSGRKLARGEAAKNIERWNKSSGTLNKENYNNPPPCVQSKSKLGLAQLVRLLVVELIYSDSNSRFDMSIIFTTNYFFSVTDDVPVDNETFLMTDFINLKIKLAQSFGRDHMDRVYIRVFIWMNAHTYMSIYIYTIFLLKKSPNWERVRDPNSRLVSLSD